MGKYDNVTFKEYQKKKLEMLNGLGRIYSNEDSCLGVDCSECPLEYYNNGKRVHCENLETLYPEIAIEIVMEHEQKVDWTKVEVDTKILVRDNKDNSWERRYFAKYEDGKVFAWGDGATSYSKDTSLSWTYAKLYNEEDE